MASSVSSPAFRGIDNPAAEAEPESLATSAPGELAPDYYLQHFSGLIEHVQRLYADLLSADEQQFIKGFGELSHGAACLLVRLLCRSGEWFRLDKLNYQEIAELQNAADELIARGLLITQRPPWDVFVKGVTLAELRELLRRREPFSEGSDGSIGPGTGLKLNKSQLTQALENEAECILELQPFAWVQLNCRAAVNTLMLCYFGNSYQELSQFVLVDLGIQTYEQYPILQQDRKFDCREDIDLWLTLDSLMVPLMDPSKAVSKNNAKTPSNNSESAPAPLSAELLSLLRASRSGHPAVERRLDNARNACARHAERQGAYDLALSLYRLSALAPARERSIRCLEHLQRWDDALQLLAVTLSNPLLPLEERDGIKRLGRRLVARANKLGLPMTSGLSAEPLAQLPLSKLGIARVDLVIARHQSAEHSLIAHIHQAGWQGKPAKAWYVENQLLCAVFGLAFWDIIFARQKGMFVHPFQLAPLDMWHPEFTTRRAPMLAARLAQLAGGDLSPITTHLHTKRGIANAWVNWKSLDETLISTVLRHLTSSQLTGLLELMLKDLRFMRAGMPDLLLLVEDITGPRLEWVEVKGPGDSLRDNQRLWLSQLSLLDLPAHLCHVSWSEDS
ncbi:VRR-NUC domain-containing protein [Shewanella sp. GXUN23E]|uniref:VRR-NUC domain-containing protein n=1 Tax=Shewanella sp. GXUN23E TaxID=3422498 RepID=UPI003D7EAC36